ncbi:hypothetical protein Tco_0638409 [Tanacetum coccineum]
MTSRPRTRILSRPRLEIMAALAITISFDSLDESVGSPPSRVILFGDIPTVIPSTSMGALETSTIVPVTSSAAPVVETTLVASPTGLCGLVPYSDSDSDSHDERDSPEYITPLPATLPFLYTDSSEAPDSSDGPPSQDPYVTTVARWRSRVTTHSPSPSDFPIAPVTASPEIRRRAAVLIRLGEAIPLGRPYRTHPNGPQRVMTARKRVGPLPARRLAWRRVSPHSSDHRPSSSGSSSDSSPVHSSGLDAPGQTHSGSSTRVVSPRLGYPPRRAPRRSEAFHRWCAAPLSTLYPPTTSESSSGDSSERPMHHLQFCGPISQRCIPSVDSVPSSTPVMVSLAPTLPVAEGLIWSWVLMMGMMLESQLEIVPPRDRIYWMSGGEPTREDSSDSSSTRDGTVRSFKDMLIDLDDAVRDFYHHMSEGRKRARMIERIESLRLENLKVRAMLNIERDHVNSLRLHMSLSQEEFRQVRRDRDDTRRRLRRLESYLERRFGFRP